MLGRVALVFAVMLGAYALLAGQVSMTEALAGVPTAAAMTAYVVVLHRIGERRMRFVFVPWGRLLGVPTRSLLPDAARVGRMLLRALWRRPAGAVGVLSRQPFRHGGDDPADAARRGLVTVGISLAPNGYVLDVPDGQDVLALHRLVPAAPSPEREWPL